MHDALDKLIIMLMRSHKIASKFESGQAIVLILLSLSVVLTMVLFIVSRSITDVTTSTEQADSVRAFSAAEAGVEKALITGAGTDGGSVTIGNASYTVDVKSDASNTFNYPTALLSGETMTLWFMSHKSDGSLTCDSAYPACFASDEVRICWGNPGTSSSSDTTPAIEASVYYDTTPAELFTSPPTYSNVKIARAAYDPNAGRTSTNSFTAATTSTCTISGVNYAFQTKITFSAMGGAGVNNNGLMFAKIRMMYNTDKGQPIGFSGPTGVLFPPQGITIVSTGTSTTSTNSQSNPSYRRVNVFRGWQEFPLSGLAIFIPAGISQ